jgi:hypothetical protein
LEIKLKGRHFDTTEAIGAESQAVLNMASRKNLQNGRSAGNGAYARKETTLRVVVVAMVAIAVVASRPRVSF